MKSPPHRRLRGFTMVELLVGIIIIAVLSSLGFFGANRMMQRGRATHCLGNLRNIGPAILLYTQDHNGLLPVMETGRDSKAEDVPVLDTVLEEYFPDKRVFHCKADRGQFEKCGCSYLWNNMLNGQKYESANIMGMVTEHHSIPVVYDREAYHRDIGNEVNILYLDGHVSEDLKMDVEKP